MTTMTIAALWRIDPSTEGILAPGRWFWLRSTIWMAGLFALALLTLIASLRLGDWIGLPENTKIYVGIFTPLAGLAVCQVAVTWGERRHPNELALADSPKLLAAGTLVGFAFMALSLAILWLLHLNAVGAGHWQHALHYLVFNAWISGVAEELGFRAVLLRLLARMLGPVRGLVISSALFALAHATHAPPTAVGLLMINGGLLLGVLYMTSGSLWVPIAAHVAYDFTEWSLFGVGDHDGLLVVVPSAQYPSWLTGGTFGPDGSMLSALVALGLIAGVLVSARRRCPA